MLRASHALDGQTHLCIPASSWVAHLSRRTDVALFQHWMTVIVDPLISCPICVVSGDCGVSVGWICWMLSCVQNKRSFPLKSWSVSLKEIWCHWSWHMSIVVVLTTQIFCTNVVIVNRCKCNFDWHYVRAMLSLLCCL